MKVKEMIEEWEVNKPTCFGGRCEDAIFDCETCKYRIRCLEDFKEYE